MLDFQFINVALNTQNQVKLKSGNDVNKYI